MDQIIEYLTNPLFIVLIVFIVLMVSYNTLKKMGRGKAWKQIAAETGLQPSKHETATYHDQQLSGIYRNRSLDLTESVSEETNAYRRENQRGGNRIDTSTDIRLKINVPKGIKLKIKRIITIGAATPVTGNAEIDRHFDIISEPDWLAPKVLASANVRQKLPQLKMGGTILVQEAELLFDQPGRISDVKYLRFLLDFLSDLAGAVEECGFE